MNQEQRNQTIIKTSMIGILANILLAGFKAAVGIASNSIAVILDAVNNLSDALSSMVTIVGAKLAGKLPDKKHPLGYGRIEYLTAMIVSGIVLYAGITSAVESFKKLIRPENPDYSIITLLIIGVAVVVKLILGRYVTSKGEKVNSGALIASGSDASFDAVLSLSVFVSAIVYMLTGISLEAFVGLVISFVIIRAGIEMMIDTLNEILGMRADAEVTKKIKQILSSEPEVRGAYDLILYNYGPDRNMGSVHLELPDTMTVAQVDTLTRKVEEKVYKETGVALTGVGVYSFNTTDDEAAVIEDDIRKRVLSHEGVLQMHGFYLDAQTRSLRFDVVLSFDIDIKEEIQRLYEQLQKVYPDYQIVITPDVDVSD